MAALQHLEFFLLRYAGDATKGESINLGVVAIGPDDGRSGGFADLRFTRNWRRLHCFDPLVDTEELEALELEIRRDLQHPERRAELLKRTGDSWSNLIRCEPLHGCLTEWPAKELEKLSSIYLETPILSQRRELAGRQRILARMEEELEKSGVLPFMLSQISVVEYTKAASLPKIDLGYSIGQSLKFLQAVSLAPRVNAGLVWAKRFPEIAAGMREKKGVAAWMTAIVDDDVPRADEISLTLDLMQTNGIVVAPAARMSEIAEGIRVELKG
jgi:hypothetical protein